MGEVEPMRRFERVVLQALLRLGGDAYGMTIRREVARQGGWPVSIGSVYGALDRLKQRGFVTSRPGDPAPERGDRLRCCFRIEATGVRALHAGSGAKKPAWNPLFMAGAEA